MENNSALCNNLKHLCFTW